MVRKLVWVSADGEEPIAAEPRTYTYVRLSPDGSRAAIEIRDRENDIWVWDFTRETLSRLTFAPGTEVYPVWTPDGARIAFGSTRDRTSGVFWRAADGTGSVEQLTENSSSPTPYAFSPDGQYLVFRERTLIDGVLNDDLHVLTLDETRTSRPLIATEFSELNAEISPDGRWLAYDSNESGRTEVYVRPFPEVDDGRWQVSTAGGSWPVWSADGQTLFFIGGSFLGPTGMVAVSVQTSSGFASSSPEVVVP